MSLKNEEIEQARLEINDWSSTVKSNQVVRDAIKNGEFEGRTRKVL